METGIKTVCLACIGYKYYMRKGLTFVLAKGTGSLKPGDLYKGRFSNKFGNVCVRYVARSDVIYAYFQVSNRVNLHYQVRKYVLTSEKK